VAPALLLPTAHIVSNQSRQQCHLSCSRTAMPTSPAWRRKQRLRVSTSSSLLSSTRSSSPTPWWAPFTNVSPLDQQCFMVVTDAADGCWLHRTHKFQMTRCMLSCLSLMQVYGDDNVVALLKQLQPSVIIPFMNAEMQVTTADGCAPPTLPTATQHHLLATPMHPST
jgi:hypothetical protein